MRSERTYANLATAKMMIDAIPDLRNKIRADGRRRAMQAASNKFKKPSEGLSLKRFSWENEG